ncbi:ATP-dependent RecD-like DNA helicase [Anaerotignum faecicola]|nr:ATP-dependent RecD-like DNA helicase [Anaerotignum faecicola]
MSESVVLEGTVEDIIFQNSDNGYAVFSVDNGESEVICVGIVPNLHNGESLKVIGNWTVHPSYGRQLSVEFYEKTIPTTIDGIEKYLSSGVIKGIGPKTAKKIVEKFGETTFYIIEEKPDRLVEIKGLTYEKAVRISQVFREQHELRRVMIFLQNFGVTPVYAMKIYKKYKEKTFDIVNTNPYRLADDITGIGFKMADKLAASAGIAEDAPGRIKAAVKYILNKAAQDGHVYLPQDILLENVKDITGVDATLIENGLLELQIEHQIWRENLNDEVIIYLNLYYYSEISSAKKMIELLEYRDEYGKDWDSVIDNAEISTGIKLADKQREAVKEALTEGALIITGGPGTGKTTTINTIIKILEKEGRSIMLGAPTGRAAKRMTEATGMGAQTIHRMLGINFIDGDSRTQSFEKDEDDPIDADVIIIDESSMIDILLMNSFLRAVRPGTRLILVGDVDQLPSVGAGNVLKDLIKSNVIKVVRLTEIFRQAQESAIITNAHRINNGLYPVLNDKTKDFFFVKRSNAGDVVTAIKDLITRRLPAFNGCDPVNDIQVLTPMKKGILGVQEINKVLQETLNPPHRGKKEKAFRMGTFRQGDKVMQIKNNYNMAWKVKGFKGKVIDEGLGIFNGDCGIIHDIDESSETMSVIFDDNKLVEYDFTQLEELELAYAVTIHKSQGSEYPVVIVPIHSGPPMLLSRNLLYTAVTRAKKLAVLVGIPETMNKMVDNNREINRYSTLDKRICSLYEFMHQE